LSLTAAQAQPAAQQNQQAQPSPPVAWHVECTGDGKTLDCRAAQQFIEATNRQVIAIVAIRPAGKAGSMMIQLPLGLNLESGVQIKVDDGAAEKQPIQTCTNGGCFVTAAASEKLIASCRTGKNLILTFLDANKRTIDVSLSLLGFGLAIDKAAK
jgi:invasion protein IalB